MRKIFLMISLLLGLSQMTIAQNVGIGTTAPAYKLDIQSTASVVTNLQSSGSTAHFQAVAPSGAEAGINLSTYTAGIPITRWLIAKGDGVEAGSNGGSNFIINRYDDAGTYLGRPLEIVRSTGEVLVNNKLTTPNFQFLTGATNGYILQSDASGNASWVSPSSSVVVAGTGLSYSGNTLNSVWTVSGNNIYKNNSGNVGIGTTSPTELLQVGSNNSADNYIKIESGGVGSNYSGIKLNEPGFDFGWTLRQDAATDDLTLDKQDGAFTNVVTFKRSGNVGIGVSAPVAQLHLSNNLSIDEGANNTGDLLNGALRFGGSSGEGIASNRSIAGNENGLDFYTGYTNRMSITNSGNIGIGTQFPTSRFHINLGSDKLLKLESTSASGTWLEMENTSAGGATFSIISTGSANGEGAGKLLINTPGNQLAIDNSGKLGIGTTSPSSTLHVKYGSANTSTSTAALILDNPLSGTQTSLQFRINGTETGRIRSDLNGNMVYSSIGNGDQEFREGDLNSRMIIKGTTGYVGIGTSTPGAKMEVTSTDGNSLMVSSSNTDQTDFKINNSTVGTSRLRWTGPTNSEGQQKLIFISPGFDATMTLDQTLNRVGIGTTSPSSRLDVSGTTTTTDLVATSGLRFVNGATNGYVLQSDASGNASWVAPSSLSTSVWTVSGSHIYKNNTGNVGIGTSTPTSLLHIYNASGGANLNIQSGTANASLNLNAGASGTESSIATHTNGSQRWSFGKSNGAESGSDAGSDFFINRYNDAGAFQGQPFIIKRSNGNIGIGGIGNPVQKVDVAGNINVSSSNGYYIGNTRVLSINGTDNLFAGVSAGVNNSSSGNTFIGKSAGEANTAGTENTAVGVNALTSNTGGDFNTALGSGAGVFSSGSNNVFVGIGAGAVAGSNNIIIGSGAGGAETGNNKLYIDNSNTSSPLIYGDFSADSMSVNGSLNVQGAISMNVKSSQVAGTNNPDATASIWIYSSGSGTIDLTNADYTDRMLVILNNSGGARTISSYRDLSNTAQTSIANNASLWLVYDGTNWRQIK